MLPLQQMKKISSALISVYYKEGLEPILNLLQKLEVKIYSTGGTQTFIENLNMKVTPVEAVARISFNFGR